MKMLTIKTVNNFIFCSCIDFRFTFLLIILQNARKKNKKQIYEGGSICNENPFVTPSTNALGFNAICQTKDQSVAIIMVHEPLFYLSKFNKLHTF